MFDKYRDDLEQTFVLKDDKDGELTDVEIHGRLMATSSKRTNEQVSDRSNFATLWLYNKNLGVGRVARYLLAFEKTRSNGNNILVSLRAFTSLESMAKRVGND